MSNKSKSSAKVLDRPFAQGIMEKARRTVRAYRVTLEFSEGQYFGRCVEIPGARGDGRTANKCVESTLESAAAVAAYMLEKGQPLPPAAREGVRSEQVNVRLSADEKSILAANADRLGFKGLADYIRAVALGFGRSDSVARA